MTKHQFVTGLVVRVKVFEESVGQCGYKFLRCIVILGKCSVSDVAKLGGWCVRWTMEGLLRD